MSNLDLRYHVVLLPHAPELCLPGDRIDLNLAEEVLAPHGLRDLDRAERVARALLDS